MTEIYPWYGLAEGDELEQGDMLVDCPTYSISGDRVFDQEIRNVVVLSHSCDLAHDKLTIVQVCPYWFPDELGAHGDHFRSSRGREELRRGNIPGYHLLNRCSIGGLERGYIVCDFRALIGVTLDTAKALAAQQSPRLRLLPPYREHLTQAFARFFMRVGLPVDVPPFR